MKKRNINRAFELEGGNVELSSQCHLVAGEIFKALGDYVASENHFRKCIDIRTKYFKKHDSDIYLAYQSLGRTKKA